MTVKELIEKLNKVPKEFEDCEIVMQEPETGIGLEIEDLVFDQVDDRQTVIYLI